MMAELRRIAGELQHAVEGEAWHGPAVLEILADVDARTAAAHPIAGAHSIWELLNHMTAWTGAVMRRMDGEAVELEGDRNFPPVIDGSDSSWKAAIARFQAAQKELLARFQSFPVEQLARTVPGRKYDFLFMFDGLVQHHLYHAGQMILLKKASAANREPGR